MFHLQSFLASHKEVIDAEPIDRQRAIIDREGISQVLVDVEQHLPQVPLLKNDNNDNNKKHHGKATRRRQCLTSHSIQDLQKQIRSPRFVILKSKEEDYGSALAACQVHFPVSALPSCPVVHWAKALIACFFLLLFSCEDRSSLWKRGVA